MEQVAHYTDAVALQSILLSGKIWLTDIRYLNDEHEYVNGENFIRKIFEARALADGARGQKVVKFFEDCVSSGRDDSYTFVGCFSQRMDSLSQWRSYCPKTGGLALEFSPDAIDMKLHVCLYDDAEKSSDANSLYDIAIAALDANGAHSKLFGTMWANIARFKHKAFTDEAERRVLIFQRKGQAAKNNRVKFRAKGNLIIPYIDYEVKLEHLLRIRIGPCAYPELARNSVQNLVDALAQDKNHPFSVYKPEVEVSEIPYRA